MTPEERAALTTKLRGGVEPSAEPSRHRCTRVIAVASGKGGVGKSTPPSTSPRRSPQLGREVGVLDADIYGHSIPHMLGIRQKPVVVDKMIVPPVAHDLRLMSIGFFLDDNAPVMWRGPMLHRALEQFLQTSTGASSTCCVVDMPPGTGDVSISLGQLLPRAEAVVVTTPQPLAQEVASRAATMAQKTGMRLLGVVENMTSEVFGTGGGARLAEQLEVPLLGQVPLDAALRECGDAGVPLVLSRSRLGCGPGDLRDRRARSTQPRRRLHEDPQAGLGVPDRGRPAAARGARLLTTADVEALADHFLDAERRGQARPRAVADRLARDAGTSLDPDRRGRSGSSRSRATSAGTATARSAT